MTLACKIEMQWSTAILSFTHYEKLPITPRHPTANLLLDDIFSKPYEFLTCEEIFMLANAQLHIFFRCQHLLKTDFIPQKK